MDYRVLKRLSILLSLFLVACAVQQEVRIRSGKEYGVTEGAFRGRWWNYYERGISYADGSFFEEAISDFRTAIGKRGDDQWRARSYGMHFVNYFPHRELGIVFFRQEKLKEAIRELESSLGTAESSKAKYFLNKARESFIRKTGIDNRPPSLNIANVGEDVLTNALALTVTGEAEDDQFVSSVTVDGTPVFLELSVPRFRFTAEVWLEEGVNRIPVRAMDLAGKETEEVIAITADRKGPVITVSEIQDGPSGRVISGFVTDENGVRSLSINGQPRPAGGAKQVPFENTTRAPSLRIESFDAAGNRTVAEVLVVKKAALEEKRTKMAFVPFVKGRNETSDAIGPVEEAFRLAVNLGGLTDREPPLITVEELSDRQEVFENQILLAGKVTDNRGVESITINGEEVLQQSGSQVFFTRLVGLKVGDNPLVIQARDTGGHTAIRDILVVRKIQKIRQTGSRLRAAILPMERQGAASASGDAVYDSLIVSFISQGRFNILERAKIDSILDEIKLSSTDLVDVTTAVKMGRLAAADVSLIGTVVEKEGSIEIIARLVDTETSEVLVENDVFDEKKDLASVQDLMDILAFKFKRDLPLVEGMVIDVEGDNVTVNIGEEKRVWKNSRLILYEEGPAIRHPVTGRVLGSDTRELAEARVSEVFDTYSNASVTGGKTRLKTRVQVITK